MPSQTPIVETSSGVPPAMRMPYFTASPTLSSIRWPGMISFAELTTATSGREISSSVRPSAFSRLRCGAFERPPFMRSLAYAIARLPSCMGRRLAEPAARDAWIRRRYERTAVSACYRPAPGREYSAPAVPPRLALVVLGSRVFDVVVDRMRRRAPTRAAGNGCHRPGLLAPAACEGRSRVRGPVVLPSGSGASFETSCAGLPPLPGSLVRGLASTLPRQSLSCCAVVVAEYRRGPLPRQMRRRLRFRSG